MQPIIIAGPCSAESEEQLYCTAQQLYDHLLLSSHKLSYFRTGIWKPRSRPKEFQGAGKAALPWLNKINRDFGFPICVEVASPEHLHDCLEAGIKTVWIGSRTAVNPFVVQELADTVKGEEITVLVKNPIVPDLKLWIGNIERFLNASVKEVIAIHRGFSEKNERVYRYHPMWDIPIELKVHYPDIPIICDPSHISGNKKHIAQISQIALDYGFNGLMIETHYRPKEALSDARQQITPIELTHLLAHLSFKSTLTSPAENELRKQRNLIENIDTQISELLHQRMNVVDIIAQIKIKNNLPVVQPKQWNKVVQTYTDQTENDIKYKDFIQKYLELLHQSSIERQRND